MNHRIVMEKQKLFSKLISTHTYGKLEEKIPMTSQYGAATWKVTLKSALNAVANWRTRRLTNLVDQFQRGSTLCLADHQVKTEDVDMFGELSGICSQIVLKCLCLARVRRHIYFGQ